MAHTNLTSSNIDKIDVADVGNRWTAKGDRLYLADDFMLKALGLEVQYYKKGRISSATQDGEAISNSQATKLIEGCRRAWVDLTTGELRDCTRTESEVRIVAAINALVEDAQEEAKEEAKEEAREEAKAPVYPDICPIFRDDQCEIISVNGHIYARFTTEEAHWDSRVRFNPLFLDRWAKVPLTAETVRALDGNFDMEDGWSTSPTSIVASGFYYNPTGWHWNLGKEAGERIRLEFSGDLEDADARYKVREYWWDLRWELDWATDPLTAVQYGWDPSAVITPENRAIVMGGKKHFHILSMEDVQYLAMHAKKVRGRIWRKVEAVMDTSKVPTEPWSIKPFVDEAVAEFAIEHSPKAMTFSDIRGFEWQEDGKALTFLATDNAGENHTFKIVFDHRDRGDLKLATPGQRWDWASVGDDDRPGMKMCSVHRPGTGYDYEAEVKAFFAGRLFYWHNDLLYSFTR